MTNKTTPGSTFKNHQITDLIIQEIQSGNYNKWVRPWVPVQDRPRNFNGALYGPMNNFLLSLAQMHKGYSNPFWITANKGRKEKGWLSDEEEPTCIYTYVRSYVVEKDGQVKWYDTKPREKHSTRYVLRTINMYNVEQFKWQKIPENFDLQTYSNPKIKEDMIVHTIHKYAQPYLDKHRVKVLHRGDRAYYHRVSDLICLPKIEAFTSPHGYAQTFAHELVHSTGHKSRLDRYKDDQEIGDYSVEEYSLEELVAELGSNIILHDLGVEFSKEQMKQTAGYMEGWASRLSTEPKWFAWADSRAKKAKNMIEKEQPKESDNV